jgi:ABC-2 type transport system permease protein
MRAALAIALKDIRLLARDRVGFFFIFIFPAIFGILFGLIFAGAAGSGPSGISVGWVDNDGSEQSAALLDKLQASSSFTVTAFESSDAATDAVRRGQQRAVLIVPQGFGQAYEQLVLGGGIRVEGIVDPGAAMTTGMVEGSVTGILFEMLAEQFSEPERARSTVDDLRAALADSDDVDPAQRLVLSTFLAAADNLINSVEQTAAEDNTESSDGEGFSPISIDFRAVESVDRDGPRSAFDITFPQACAWGLLGVVTGFGSLVAGERQRGTLSRLLMAPLTRAHVLGGKALGCFLTALAVQALLLLVGRLAFGVVPDSWFMLGLAVISACVGFVGLMMLLAVVSKTEAGSEGLARAVLLVLALVGGAGVPLAFMPDWVRVGASVSPFKWAILALEGAIWRDYALSEMLPACAVLLGMGVVSFLIAARLFRSDATTA